jgi:drug/metabolite transporter (DMT)-like permease
MAAVSETSSTGLAGGLAAAIWLRIASTGLFACMSLCVRQASFSAPVGQIVFWRSAVALLPILAYLAFRREIAAVITKHLPVHVRRSLYGCLAMFLSFLSLAYLPLSLATALSYLAPLIVIPYAVLMLKERPGLVVIGATALGFLGVVLMLVPAYRDPASNLGTLLGVASGIGCAIVTAMAKVEIKRLTDLKEATGAIAFYFAVISATAGLLTLPITPWASAEGQVLPWLIGAGLCGGFAHITMVEAVARAPVSTLAPIEYTAMLWAIGFDLLFFALLPAPISLIGCALVVLAACVVAFMPRRPA